MKWRACRLSLMALSALALVPVGCVAPGTPKHASGVGSDQADAAARTEGDESLELLAGVDDELLINVYWNAKDQAIVMRAEMHPVLSTADLETLVRDFISKAPADSSASAMLISISPTREVPWAEIKRVIAACERAGAEQIGVQVDGHGSREMLEEMFEIRSPEGS